VFGPRVCLPCLADIGLETTHGCHRVTAAEWMMLKGFKKGSPSNHLWAAIGKRVMPLLFSTTALEQTFLNRYDSEQGPGGATSDREKGTPALSSKNTVNEWTWQPPSFHKRGRWYRTHVANLCCACAAFPDAA
jgi:hypothetical protein